MGMTMAEKALARAAGKDAVRPGEFVTAEIDLMMGHDLSFFASYMMLMSKGVEKVKDPEKIAVVVDHFVPAPNAIYAGFQKSIREAVHKLGIRHFWDAGEGICHQVIPEQGLALPGRLIVGADSHTTTYGALAAAATGIGVSELAYAMAKGSLWFMVPESIRYDLQGRLSDHVSAMDIILALAGEYGCEAGQYKSLEFSGPGAESLSIEQRMTISNMSVELGAKFAFFQTDARTEAYLKERTNLPLDRFGPDPDANYCAVHEIDISALEPHVACPHDVDNVIPISKIQEVPIDQAVIGGCTNGRFEDFARAAAILKGRKVARGTRLLAVPSSREVLRKMETSGVLRIFMDAQAIILPPGCGPCMGGHQGILAPGETAVSTTNRNFKGRMGSTDSFIYLASPETVAASAIAGRIADPRKHKE